MSKPEEERKHACLYRLMDECLALKFVEESMASRAVLESLEKGEHEAVERAMSKTKGISFNDAEVAKKLGEDVAKGVSAVLGPLMQASGPNKAQIMANYCGMCPTLHKEMVSQHSQTGDVRPPAGVSPFAGQ
jgi:hypothetical protein